MLNKRVVDVEQAWPTNEAKNIMYIYFEVSIEA
jgi:hypothetical protein